MTYDYYTPPQPCPFKPGDLVFGIGESMAKGQRLLVFSVMQNSAFKSGFGVQVRVNKRKVYLCSWLFRRAIASPPPESARAVSATRVNDNTF